MDNFDQKKSYVTQQEIDYCDRLNRELDARRASEDFEKKDTFNKQKSKSDKWVKERKSTD